MKETHPNRCHAMSAIVVLAAICGGGCHSQQTALSNPFMAPDRVPPPATRVVAPGSAQPYYPGDPLPAAHASATPPAPTIATAAASAASAAPTATPPTALAFSNERTVSVPADDSSLRFALPSPPQATNMAAAPTPAPFAVQPTQPQIIPASYTAADPNRANPASVADSAPVSPWRSPQVPMSSMASAPPISASPAYAAATSPQPFPQVAGPTIPVTLRAVPSPTADEVVSQPPRIRFPSYDAALQMASATSGGPAQQAAFVAPPTGIAPQPASQSGLPQTLPITELPSSGALPGLGPASMPSISVANQPQSPVVASPDGFRPRSAMR